MTFNLSVGMIIGIIVLIIVILVILALFMPISYRLDADIDEKKVFFKIRYLGFIRFFFSYDEDIRAVIRVLFIKLDLLKLSGRNRRKGRKKKDKKKDERTRLRRIRDGAAAAKRMFSVAAEYGLMEAVMPPIKKFLFKCRPRKIKGHIGFGFADPSVTGYITGAIAVLPVIYQTDLSVIPDFDTDETFVKGNVHAAGHMRMAAIIILAAGLIRQKGVRAFIGALRKKK